MGSFKTVAIPKAKPLKLARPRQPQMPSLRLPTMKTGAEPRLPKVSIAAVHGAARTASPRPYSSALSKAASAGSPTAAAAGNGMNGWRNQGRVKRPQQDSPLGFFNQ